MGYHIGKSLRVRDSGKNALRDLYSSARHFGLSHSEIMTRRNEIYDQGGINAAPHWVKSYLEGYWQHIMDSAYRYDLMFGGTLNGRFYSTHSDRSDYYAKCGISAREYADDGRVRNRGHYWIATGKVFFADSQRTVCAG